MTVRRVFSLLFFLWFVIAPSAYAQSTGSTPLSITSSPAHPEPRIRVHLMVASSLMNLSTADLTWYANNAVIAKGVGVTEADIITGELGSEVRVIVMASNERGGATGEASIRPTEVDLLYESDSYAPPFYRGRTLPSAGSSMKVQALARFKQGNVLIPPSDLFYTWKRNASVVQSVSGKGKSTAILPGPALFGTDSIEVTVETSDGGMHGGGSVLIPSVEPILLLYPNHPLFGTLFNQAVFDGMTVSDSEVTLDAIPYFAHVQRPDDPTLNFSWNVNGKPVPVSGDLAHRLTINAGGSTGTATIELALTQARNWFLRASKTWRISFGPGSTNVFNTIGADPFNGTNSI